MTAKAMSDSDLELEELTVNGKRLSPHAAPRRDRAPPSAALRHAKRQACPHCRSPHSTWS